MNLTPSTFFFTGGERWPRGVGTPKGCPPGGAGGALAWSDDPHPMVYPWVERLTWNWDPEPTVLYGEYNFPFRYDANTTEPQPLYWWLTGYWSSYFEIDSNGVMTNSSIIGFTFDYSFTLWARNIYSFQRSILVRVIINDTLAPTWIEEPEDQFLEYGLNLRYEVNATDAGWGIKHYWLNDTYNFMIGNYSGEVTANSSLAIGVYGLEVRCYDYLDNFCSATFKVTVDDTIVPEFLMLADDMEFFEFETGTFALYWEVSDINLENYIIYLNGTEVDSGDLEGGWQTINYEVLLDGLSVGTYNYTIVVTDIVGHTISDQALLVILPSPTDHTTPTGNGVTLDFLPIVTIVGGAVVVIIVIVVIMKRR